MIAVGGKPIRITTPRLLLRPVQEEDVTDDYVSGLNDPSVNEYLVSVKLVRQTPESVKAFVAANRDDPNGVLFGIFLFPMGQMIGTVRLHSLEPVHRTATIGVCIFLRQYWGQGYSAEAIAAVSDWALQHLSVRYLEASCYKANPASLRAFLKAGFQVAARFEDKYLLNGWPAPVIYLKRVRPTEAVR